MADLWASDPAGGVGWRNGLMAGVELESNPPFLVAGVKFPPRKCRIWAEVGCCGVGASRSTAATTNGPQLEVPMTLNVGGPAVATSLIMR